MRSSPGPSKKDSSVSRQIDAIVRQPGDWRGQTLSRLRTLIKEADPELVEEVKWKMPSNPLGIPVWSHHGIVCVANILKKAVRLTFPRGAKVRDPKKLFNARLESKSVRAVDFREGESIDEAALRALVIEAVGQNISESHSS